MNLLHAKKTDVSRFATPKSRRRQVSTDAATRTSIARLGVEHEPQLSQLLMSLDLPSRVNRFGHPASDACVRAYAKSAVATATFLAGTFVADTLVGVVEVFAAGRDGVAELAFAVHSDWRRRGLCSALMEVARQWAAQSGVRTLRMVIARNNWPMRQLAAKAGARLDLELDEIYADIALDIPTTRAIAA